MKESLVSILPAYLLSVLSSMLSGLLAQLQVPNDGDNKNAHINSPVKEAVAVLRTAGQQILSDHVCHGMNPEEQLGLVYLIYYLNMSLAKSRGSLVQLQQSPELARLAALLLNICRIPQKVVSEQDLLMLVVTALASMIYEHGVVVIQDPTIMEAIQALETEGIGLLGDNPVGHLFQCSLIGSALEEHISHSKAGSYTDTVQSAQSPPHMEDKKEEENLPTSNNRELAITYSNDSTFANISTKQLLGESRNSYKLYSPPIDEGVECDSITGDRLFVHNCTVTQTIPIPILPDKNSTVKADVKDVAAHKSIILPHLTYPNKRPQVEDNRMVVHEGMAGVHSLDSSSNHSPVCSTVSAGQLNQSQTQAVHTAATIAVYAEGIPPAPNPSTPWCWKRRLKPLSAANVQHYINNVGLKALEELDTECHETICHAVVSIFEPSRAVAIVRALKKRTLKVFSQSDKLGNTPLHNAILTNNLMFAKEVLSIHSASLHIPNKDHATPIDVAMHLNHHHIVECLLNDAIKHDPHSTSSMELIQSCLLKAMKIGYTEYLKILLRLQSKYALSVDYECTDSDNHTAWFYLQQKEQCMQNAAVEVLRSSPMGLTLLDRLLRQQTLDIHVFPQQTVSYEGGLKKHGFDTNSVTFSSCDSCPQRKRYISQRKLRQRELAEWRMIEHRQSSSESDTRAKKRRPPRKKQHDSKRRYPYLIQGSDSTDSSTGYESSTHSSAEALVLSSDGEVETQFVKATNNEKINQVGCDSDVKKEQQRLDPLLPMLLNSAVLQALTLHCKPRKEKCKGIADGAEIIKPLPTCKSNYCIATTVDTSPDVETKPFPTSVTFCDADKPVCKTKTKERHSLHSMDGYPTKSLPLHVGQLKPEEPSKVKEHARTSKLSQVRATIVSEELPAGTLPTISSEEACEVKQYSSVSETDIVVVGTTYPASNVFGSKRRHFSIKDIRQDSRHDQFNVTHFAFEAVPTDLDELHSRHYLSSSKLLIQNQGNQSKAGNGKAGRNVSSGDHQLKPVQHDTTPLPGFCSMQSIPTVHTHPHSEPGDHKDRLRCMAELLHAQDYPRLLPLSYNGRPPPSFPPKIRIPYVFIAGLAFYKMSNHKKSVEYFQQCLHLAEECYRDGDITVCSIYIGDIEFAQRKYLEAADKYRTALHHYSRDSVASDFRMILPTKSAVWSKCGSAFKNASRMGDAVTAYEQAIEVASSKKDRLSAHTSLGNLYQGIGENDRAVSEYEEAITLATDLKDDVSLGWNHGNLGNALLGLHQRDKALHHLYKALDMAVDFETTPQAISRAYNNLGTAYQSLNELKKAKEHYDLALAQAIYGNDIPGQARVYGNIGNLQMLNKQFDRAVSHYTEVMRLSQDKSTITTAHHNRGCAYYDWAEKKKKDYAQRSATNESAESNKTTFKVSMHGPNFEDALLVAEQSRARTLGELLLKRRGPQLENKLESLPSLPQLKSIVERQHHPVLYLSYTGERLLGWLLVPEVEGEELKGECTLNMFEVPLSDGEFDGKSFDYHLRYSLNKQLVERSFEMYKPFKHDKDNPDPVAKLHDLVAKPVIHMLKTLKKQDALKKPQDKGRKSSNSEEEKQRKVIVIPDSYTNLLPFTCTLDRDSWKLWGDDYYFQIIPSLLTMGILDQLPKVSVAIPVEHQQMLCVVGNPTIPPFKYNNDEWNLGKLPHATKEAEWVSHILKCKPILHEQATKDAVMMRIMNAKVIHLATHGSAVAGFLAFAGMTASTTDTVDAKRVLIYPEEIESLNISPALVVLSSCDSGRGVFKADGIQGMARAFILAGAQAVLTTLWRVPDESACIFMQFFYQYLVEGVKGPEALHKAILSLRCFKKYSQYIHWGGYQLNGRELQFQVNQSSMGGEKYMSQQIVNERQHHERQYPVCHINGEGFSQGKPTGPIKKYSPSLSSSEDCNYSSESLFPCGSTKKVKLTQKRKKRAWSARKQYVRKRQRKQTEKRIAETRISSSDMTDRDMSAAECLSDCNNNTSEELTIPQQCQGDEQEICNEQSACYLLGESLHNNSGKLVMTPNHPSVPTLHILDYFDQVTSTPQANIYICLYYDQERLHGKLLKANVIAFQFKLLSSKNVIVTATDEISQHLLSLRASSLQKVVVVLDAQADLFGHTVIRDLQAKWNDSYCFQSILFPPGEVEPDLPVVVQSSFSSCVVGNPTIPPTTINGNVKVFPVLPHATKEAEWVSHMLKCEPILQENATKAFVLMKMRSARLIHIATHRSGDEGYLAFSCSSSHQSISVTTNCITPQDIKDLEFHEPPVLVVLSSCGSARTSYQSGRIEGMTRAFHQAGAQVVISTNSSIWDNSPLTFMQFFYQYMITDGMMGTQALHRAMLSMRCFKEFSDPSHWGCYQYSGTELQFVPPAASSQLTSHLEPHSVFPQLECVKDLEGALLKNATNVQVHVYSLCTCDMMCAE